MFKIEELLTIQFRNLHLSCCEIPCPTIFLLSLANLGDLGAGNPEHCTTFPLTIWKLVSILAGLKNNGAPQAIKTSSFEKVPGTRENIKQLIKWQISFDYQIEE